MAKDETYDGSERRTENRSTREDIQKIYESVFAAQEKRIESLKAQRNEVHGKRAIQQTQRL